MAKHVIDYVKYGWRTNAVLAELGKELTDEGFNNLLQRALSRLNREKGNLSEIFKDEVEKFMEWVERHDAEEFAKQASGGDGERNLYDGQA